MPNHQLVIIRGHAGKDPEVTYSKSGMAIAKFSVAVTDDYAAKDKDPHTEWFNVVCFKSTAEKYVGQYLKRGMDVEVIGTLKTQIYNEKRYTDLIANKVMIGGKASGNDQHQARATTRHKPEPQPSGDMLDDDIPF